MSSDVQGQFVWFDLMAEDVADAVAFLTAVTGWTTQSRGGGEGGSNYTTLIATDAAVGGVLPIPKDAPSQSHWIAHLSTPDVDALCNRAAFVKGELLMEPTAMQGVGITALLADPAGAVLSPFQFDHGAPPPVRHELGRITFATLLVEHPDKALRVYRTLFDWKAGDTVPDEDGDWHTFQHAAGPAGASTVPQQVDLDPQWVPHVLVDDLEAALARATEAGGTIVRPTVEVAQVGQLALVASAQGVALGLIQA